MTIDPQVQIRIIDLASTWADRYVSVERDDPPKQRIHKVAETFDWAYKAIVKTVTETHEE